MTNSIDSTRSADFLLAEFQSLQSRAIGLEQGKSSRVNFLLIIAAAIGAGLAQITGNASFQPYYSTIITIASTSIALLGFFTLKHSVDDSVAIIILFRRAGRIRLWFVEQDKHIGDYVAFEYGDDRPKMDSRYVAFRGGEAVIFVITTVALCALVVTTLKPTNYYLAVLEVIVTAVVAWFLQEFYVHHTLRAAEKMTAGAIRFRYAKMYDKIKRGSK